MSMLEMLAKELMSGEAVAELAGASGANKTQVKKLVGNAVPLLVQAMSDNAGSAKGADSLMKALERHSGGGAAAEQLRQADTEDGDKILGKIFGDNKDGVTKALAKKSGVSRAKASSMLSMLAPVLLSLVSTEITSGNTPSGGLSSLLSLFTGGDEGGEAGSGSGLGDMGTALLMSALLGGNFGSGSGTAGNLMTSLLGGSQASGFTGLDGALLNGGGEGQGGLLSAVLGGSSGSNGANADLLSSMAASLFTEAFKGGKKGAKKAAAKKTGKNTAAKKNAKKPARKGKK